MDEIAFRPDSVADSIDKSRIVTPLHPQMTLSDALENLRISGQSVLPLYQPVTGHLEGILSIPSQAPLRLGGMATPLGVYLTDGTNSGGAGFVGLFLTGVSLGLLGLVAQAITAEIVHFTSPSNYRLHESMSSILPHSVAEWLSQIVHGIGGGFLTSILLFIGLRLIPMSGTHAAEHQVVHSIERGVPLTIESVRRMPRVHPRCGTNIVVGFGIFHFIFISVFIASLSDAGGIINSATFAIIAAAPITLLLWRRIGGWMQFVFATRPATDRQIAGAINAARDILNQRSSLKQFQNNRFRLMKRIWRMGLTQVLCGYATLLALLTLISTVNPSIGNLLGL